MISYQTASVADLETILGWAGAEGWNPGLDDAAAFHAADPGGFFLALEDGEPVAAISVVNHSDDFAFLGLYITRPSHRGRGVGFGLWTHALTHAGNRVVGLDGVPDQQANYAASGFVHAGGTTRFAGVVAGKSDPEIRLAEPGDLPGLIAREAAASGVAKPAYLTAWFSQTAQRRTLIASDGVCTLRQCGEGAKIGPLLADTPTAAERLIRHCAQIFSPALILDVPAASTELTALCEDLGLRPGFATARMYRGAAPPCAGGIYAVASLELG
ncbi:MAG: GNAT family N-acetyltransferase [Silicimonas sp.]|nr:GNAT family N-acetyltransferase [Silicimonas sp.]